MKKISVLLLLISVFAISIHAQSIPDHYIIHVKPGMDPAALASKHRLKADYVYSHALHGFAAHLTPGALQKLKADPSIEGISEDNVVYAFKKPGSGGTTGSTGAQTVPEGVKRIGAAPGTVGFTGSQVGVAVVDTGLDLAHADLNASIVSWSAYGGTGQDDEGHGTHVGGIIAARNNSIDVVGVAPEATVYAVKVLDSTGSGSDASVIAGLNWVLANKDAVTPAIRVVNMSLGRDATGDDSAFHVAVQNLYNAGITVVVAAGNDPSLEAKNQVPAGFAEVIAVASTTAKTGTSASRRVGPIGADTASFFTSDGRLDPSTGVGVSISAPGEDQENIDTRLFINSVGILSLKLGGGTTRLSGTSMASPHVAGMAAILWDQAIANGTSISPEDVRRRIRSSASRVGVAPLNSPTSSYSFDGEREGVGNVPAALGAP
jgi:subtilisin